MSKPKDDQGRFVSSTPGRFDVKAIEELVLMCRRNGVQELQLGTVHVKLSGQAFLKEPMLDNTKTLDAGAGASNKQFKTQAEQDDDDLYHSAMR